MPATLRHKLEALAYFSGYLRAVMANGRVGTYAWRSYEGDLVYIGVESPDIELPGEEPKSPEEETAFLEAAAERLTATGPNSHDARRATVALELTSKVRWGQIDLSGHRDAATYFGDISARVNEIDLSGEAVEWLTFFGIHRA